MDGHGYGEGRAGGQGGKGWGESTRESKKRGPG